MIAAILLAVGNCVLALGRHDSRVLSMAIADDLMTVDSGHSGPEADPSTFGVVDNSRATIVAQLRSLELQEPGAAAAAVYDQPIALRLLFEDQASGVEHYVVRYPTGLRGRV